MFLETSLTMCELVSKGRNSVRNNLKILVINNPRSLQKKKELPDSVGYVLKDTDFLNELKLAAF